MLSNPFINILKKIGVVSEMVQDVHIVRAFNIEKHCLMQDSLMKNKIKLTELFITPVLEDSQRRAREEEGEEEEVNGDFIRMQSQKYIDDYFGQK